MSVARRVLLASGGGGGFLATVPPADASWVRSGSNPILSAAVAWEQTAVQEPCVIYEAGTWKMWYRGGWGTEAIGYATSTDGTTWTKYASNPVYGGGGSGVAGQASLPEVEKVGSTYYLFGVLSPFVVGNTTFVATSSDGLAWTTQASSQTLPAGTTLWGNATVWKEGAAWFKLQEAGPSPWQIYLYTSADGLTWTIGNGGNALTSLQVAAGGMYGGPTFARDSTGAATPTLHGVYTLWYHAAPVSGSLPTNIYRATSTDKINWTISPVGPVLTYAGSGFEVDQVADPSITVLNGLAYLFYDGDDNATSTAKIGVAIALAVP